MRSSPDHEAAVDAWLARHGGRDLSNGELLESFERTMAAVWKRAESCLGAVTLFAVADRVLHDARERFPRTCDGICLGAAGFDTGDLRSRAGELTQDECRRLLRAIAVGFLRVLGRLTADVLSSALHQELR